MKNISQIINWIRKKDDRYQRPVFSILDEAWNKVQSRLQEADRIIDLGCGASPHPRATVAVDVFIEPLQRDLGEGSNIILNDFRERGVTFINADIADLSFIEDKSFDFAYSHHVFEHLVEPKKACLEMQRIASGGAIITPSAFAEVSFGRPYHLWFVYARGNTLIFVKKRQNENCPFGDHPAKSGTGYRATDRSNPFDILLNDGDWYQGVETYSRLGNLLRRYWYTHSPVMETVFLWENSFSCVVIDEDGNVS